MVWEAESSPLYRTVERFNSRESTAENNPREAYPHDDKAKCSGCPYSKNAAPNNRGGILERITSDRDFFLIAVLILLLAHEKADMKLIAALAFILLA